VGTEAESQFHVIEIETDNRRSDTPSPPLLLHARGNGTTLKITIY